MSEPVTALNGASARGFADVAEAPLQGMIQLKGDLADRALREVCTGLSGTDFPEALQAACAGERGICWMAPDEVLLLVPYAEAGDALARIDTALAGSHYLAADVSDARAVFTVTGEAAREVMAKLTPADVSTAGLSPGIFRRTRLAQVPAAFWMPDAQTFRIICFRSVARYVFDLLEISARKGGEVGYFRDAEGTAPRLCRLT